METERFTPKDFMKSRHPDMFSDSSFKDNYRLTSSMLEYYLDTLASRKQEYDFENFCRTELKNLMVQNVSQSAFEEVIKYNKIDPHLSNEFTEALSDTSHTTIDIFLEKLKKFRFLGAHLIAYTLFPLEKNANLFPARDWYAHLYNVIDFEHDKPDIKNISFVSLNYDRSLERFLMHNYKSNLAEDLHKIAEFRARKLNVIHAHGSLGSYPDIPYEINVNQLDVLRNAAEGILIVSDKLEESDDFNRAKHVISSAHNIIFIGFGYDSLTLEKLIGNPANMGNKRILGTTHGLPPPSLDILQDYFKGKGEFRGRRYEKVQKITERYKGIKGYYYSLSNTIRLYLLMCYNRFR